MTKQQEKLLENFIRREVRKSLNEITVVNLQQMNKMIDHTTYRKFSESIEEITASLSDDFNFEDIKKFLHIKLDLELQR